MTNELRACSRKWTQKCIKVVDLMVTHHKDERKIPAYRRLPLHARHAIYENRVLLNGRKVTHTETSVPCGVVYKVEVNNLNTGVPDTYEVTT